MLSTEAKANVLDELQFMFSTGNLRLVSEETEDFEEPLDFAAPKKEKTCKNGTPCGKSCISGKKTCRKTPSPDVKEKITAVKEKLKTKKNQISPTDSGVITLQVPEFTPLLGRTTTTEVELSAIGLKKDTTLLTEWEVDRLNLIRNGFDSYEDYLKTPPTGRDQEWLYVGERVKMVLTPYDYIKNKKLSEVNFTVDDSSVVHNRTSDVVPSTELREMTKAFTSFLKSPAGDRVMANTPSRDTLERRAARSKAYRKRGFIRVGDVVPNAENAEFMLLDNRQNKKRAFTITYAFSNEKFAIKDNAIRKK